MWGEIPGSQSEGRTPQGREGSTGEQSGSPGGQSERASPQMTCPWAACPPGGQSEAALRQGRAPVRGGVTAQGTNRRRQRLRRRAGAAPGQPEPREEGSGVGRGGGSAAPRGQGDTAGQTDAPNSAFWPPSVTAEGRRVYNLQLTLSLSPESSLALPRPRRCPHRCPVPTPVPPRPLRPPQCPHWTPTRQVPCPPALPPSGAASATRWCSSGHLRVTLRPGDTTDPTGDPITGRGGAPRHPLCAPHRVLRSVSALPHATLTFLISMSPPIPHVG